MAALAAITRSSASAQRVEWSVGFDPTCMWSTFWAAARSYDPLNTSSAVIPADMLSQRTVSSVQPVFGHARFRIRSFLPSQTFGPSFDAQGHRFW